MTRRNLSRREAHQGIGRARAFGFCFPAQGGAPEPVAITPQLIEAARREGKVVLYSAMDLPVGEKLGNTFQAQYPRHRGADRALRLGAAVSADRAGVFFQHPCRRRDHDGGCVSRHLVEAKRLARAFRPGGCRKIFSERISRRRRHVCDIAHLAVVNRLQHQSRQSLRGARKLRRSARSQMGRQDGQGTPRL